MTSVCPSCSRPLSELSTPADSCETVRSADVIVCQSCGFVITNNQFAETGDAGHPLEQSPGISSVSVSNRRIAHFRLVRLLGKGGFGAVWLAEDLNLGRQVALKLPKSMSKDAKLLHEAKTAAQLKHPNIVSIYEVGTAGDQIYIASEYIDGESLRAAVDQERLPIEVVVDLVRAVSRAVDHAHCNDIIHRDLKPENIILDLQGQPHVTDFGIAKNVDENETISTDGQIIGTVAYMSPEQARGNTRDTDYRSDVYAIGTMLFELLTEFRPFRGNARGILHQKLNEDPPSPRKLIPLVPRDLETICLKCIEREPGKRYQSAAAVAEELERFQQGIPIQARPVSRVEKAIRWCKRNQTVCGLLASVIASLSLGLAGTSYYWLRSERSARQQQQALYRTHMLLASNFWSHGDVSGVKTVLSNYVSGSPASDLRSSEWYYLDRSLEPFVQISEHGDAVTDVAVSRNGALFASAGRDRVVRVWDASTGDLVRTLQARGGPIGRIEFSTTSDRLVSTHNDGRVRIWNPTQHDKEAASFEHGPRLAAALFHPVEKVVISVDAVGTAIWWDLESKQGIKRVSDLGTAIKDIAISRDGTRLAIASLNGDINVLDAASGDRLHKVDSNSRIQRVEFVGGNDSLLAGAGSDRIASISLDSKDAVQKDAVQIESCDGDAVGDVAYLHQLDRLAVVLENNNLLLLDREQQLTRMLPTHSLSHGVLGQSHDGEFLAVGSGDGSIKLLAIDALANPQVLMHRTHVRDVAFVGDEGQVVTSAGDGSVHIWNTESGEHKELAPASGREMLSVAAHCDPGKVFAAGMFSEVAVFDCDDQSQDKPIELPLKGIGSLAVSSDGRFLAAGSRSGIVLVYEIADTSEPVLRINESDTQVTKLQFSPVGRTLAIAYATKQVVLLQLDDPDNREVWRFDSGPASIQFANRGETLVVGTQAGELHFVDLASGATERIDAHQGRINALGILPNEQRLLSAGRDRVIRFWDVESRSLVAALHGHERQVFGLAVSSDGQTLASVGLAGDLRLWQIGEKLRPSADAN